MASAGSRKQPVFHMGKHTHAVPMRLHGLNRKRLCERLRAREGVSPGSYVVLQGGTIEIIGGSADAEMVFRQESYFHWTFGVLTPDFYGAIEVDTGRSILFMPRIELVFSTWLGPLETPDDIRIKYEVDEVHYVDEIATVLRGKNPSGLLTLCGINTDSFKPTLEAAFDGIGSFDVDSTNLFPEISNCRVVKTDLELEVMRYANRMSSRAHRQLMREIKVGMYEYQVESLFLHNCYFYGGMRHASYTPIGASGCNCSVIHYGHAGANNEKILEDGDLCLFDMGGEYYCYASDITCCYPVNGKFTEKQKKIYETVLAAVQAVLKAVCPGVTWVDMHLLAERTILENLINHGLIHGDLEEMMVARLAPVFLPHGLGHLMGIDVHDVGGFPEGSSRREEVGLNRLRTTRILEPNMVLTVEPGVYFIDFILDEAFANPKLSKFLNRNAIDEYRGFGGVRIAEDIIVTETGVEVMTDVPRTVEDIEAWMADNKPSE